MPSAREGHSERRHQEPKRGAARTCEDRASAAGTSATPREEWVDATRELTAEAIDATTGTDYIAGADFQRRPGLCAVVAKIYRAGEKLIPWICDYVATPGVEEDLSGALVSRGYYPGPVDPQTMGSTPTTTVNERSHPK